MIKTQLENIAKEQQTKTHQTTPFTLIDSAADSSYVSSDTLIQRSMGEMISTTQQDLNISSGETHNQISSESLSIIADGQFSMTNAKDNITLSAHTGKLEATAKQDVNIASSTKEVEVVATNKITITAGGASITLDGSNITIAAKEVTEKGGKHSKAGGGMDTRFVSGLPSNVLAEPPTFIELNYLYDDETPVSVAPYRVEFADGSVREGTLDDNGFARLEGVPKGQAHVYYGEDPADFVPDRDMEDDT
ncbi:DUF2345 domain-containing protein [uncultured Psychrobacter sp.]|uniref:DUF2345 domain-containing protein n=1 Tax=uncultured Psychrobacter sp. TaxID=259303 RepID=UPI002606859C|nr:DUF2345 domain-containing protein [uncultured Psychrobacter sp.]